MYKFLLLLFFFSKTILCAPQMEIIRNESSTICEDYHLLLNFQAVTFRITGFDTEFVMDPFDGPVLRYEVDDNPICGVKNTFDECGNFENSDYTCLCELISSTEYHLTFNTTTKAPREAYEIYMKWPKKGDLTTFIPSEEFSIKEVKDETCAKKNSSPPGMKMDKLLLASFSVFITVAWYDWNSAVFYHIIWYTLQHSLNLSHGRRNRVDFI